MSMQCELFKPGCLVTGDIYDIMHITHGIKKVVCDCKSGTRNLSLSFVSWPFAYPCSFPDFLYCSLSPSGCRLILELWVTLIPALLSWLGYFSWLFLPKGVIYRTSGSGRIPFICQFLWGSPFMAHLFYRSCYLPSFFSDLPLSSPLQGKHVAHKIHKARN